MPEPLPNGQDVSEMSDLRSGVGREAPSTPHDGSGPVPSAPQVKMGVFIGGLVAALIAGFALGKVINPTSPTQGAQTGAPATSPAPSGGHQHAAAASAGSEVGGLSISSGGYTLVPGPYQDGRLSFVINGSDGKPVTTYAVVHEKQLHFILARRDLSGFQHLHPTMAPDGTWTVAAALPTPGLWRGYADFTAINPAGSQNAVTLGYDITVPGNYQPKQLPAAAREATVDGLTITYEGTPAVGATYPLLFRVTRNGTPVTNLQPYLGSFGHLVVLREGDLAYVHVHPEPQLLGGAVKFWLAAPSTGTYRMYFDFQLDGKVHTAEFTLKVP